MGSFGHTIANADVPTIRIFSSSGTITEFLTGLTANHDSWMSVSSVRIHPAKIGGVHYSCHSPMETIVDEAYTKPTATRSNSSLTKYYV
jgi:hypothetical protein